MAYWVYREDRLCKDFECSGAAEHSEDCPLSRFRELLDTPSGLLLRRAFDLDFALDVGFNVTLSEVSCEDFSSLRIVREERNRWKNEQVANASTEVPNDNSQGPGKQVRAHRPAG